MARAVPVRIRARALDGESTEKHADGRGSAGRLSANRARPLSLRSENSRHRSSVVELSIRNRVVVGSTPTGGSYCANIVIV